MREDLITDRGRPDDGDDPHGATTLGADQRVDLDDRPQEPRPLASGLRGRQRKKAENHAHAVSLYFIFYNFCRSHQTLTKAAKGVHTTPAMDPNALLRSD